MDRSCWQPTQILHPTEFINKSPCLVTLKYMKLQARAWLSVRRDERCVCSQPTGSLDTWVDISKTKRLDQCITEEDFFFNFLLKEKSKRETISVQSKCLWHWLKWACKDQGLWVMFPLKQPQKPKAKSNTELVSPGLIKETSFVVGHLSQVSIHPVPWL